MPPVRTMSRVPHIENSIVSLLLTSLLFLPSPHTDNAVTNCLLHQLVNTSHLGMAVHELRYARARMTEQHLQEHYRSAFLTAHKTVAKPPLIKTSRPILTKCPSSGRGIFIV